MTREELKTRLRQLRDEEERAIPIYVQHLESTFFLSSFKPEAQKKIKAMLRTLAVESEGHARMFEALLKKVEEPGRDVY